MTGIQVHANTNCTITHNLGLSSPFQFEFQFYDASGPVSSPQIITLAANSFTIQMPLTDTLSLVYSGSGTGTTPASGQAYCGEQVFKHYYVLTAGTVT